MQRKVLVTGGTGFIGSQLVSYLNRSGKYEITVFDRLKKSPVKNSKNIFYFKGDICSKKDLEKVFKIHGPFETIYHLAAAMPNKEFSDDLLWQINVTGTINLISNAIKNKVKSFIFTSSNVAYGIPKILPANEQIPLDPLEIYGKSKAEAEKELEKFKNNINIQIVRCPVVIGTGRLGLQAILFEFISENKNVYMLGDGLNIYQFIDIYDLIRALYKASKIKGFNIFNIGADKIMPLKNLYKKVINFANSSSKIVNLPRWPALFILAILDKLNISPLGVYQYTMIGRSLYQDTGKIKKILGWKPQKTNAETFIDNYKWYIKHKKNFTNIGSGESANRSLPKLRIFRLLKKIS